MKIPAKLRLVGELLHLPVRVIRLVRNGAQYKLMSKHGELKGLFPAADLNPTDPSSESILGSRISAKKPKKGQKPVLITLSKAVQAENQRGTVASTQRLVGLWKALRGLVELWKALRGLVKSTRHCLTLMATLIVPILCRESDIGLQRPWNRGVLRPFSGFCAFFQLVQRSIAHLISGFSAFSGLFAFFQWVQRSSAHLISGFSAFSGLFAFFQWVQRSSAHLSSGFSAFSGLFAFFQWVQRSSAHLISGFTAFSGLYAFF